MLKLTALPEDVVRRRGHGREFPPDERIQGVGEGVSTLGWSLSIDQANGQMVAAGAGENAGFVIFGACTPI